MIKKRLLPLRKKINNIDKQLISLLKKRSYIIPKVKKIKENSSFKIAFKREVDMAKSLQNADFGLYKDSYMQKIWREIISATLNIECGLKVMVYQNTSNYHDLWELAKDHWGSSNDIVMENDENIIFNKLIAKEIECAIFALPQNSNTKWWQLLLKPEFVNVRINLKLPFNLDFKTLNNCEGLCLSLNNKDVFDDSYYYIVKKTNFTISNENKLQALKVVIMDENADYYFIESSASYNDFKVDFNLSSDEIYFVGSSPKAI